MHPRLLAVAALCALLAAPLPAAAAVVSGSFSGTVDSGTDTSGVFTQRGGDLAGLGITGLFDYDTGLLSETVAGSLVTGTAAGQPSALRVTLTIGGRSYGFTSATFASVAIDAGPASQVTLLAVNSEATAAAPVVSDTLSLDASNPLAPFTGQGGLVQGFGAVPLLSTGQFSISTIDQDGALTEASATFTLGGLSLSVQGAQDVPEPGTMALLATGAGILLLGRGYRRVRTA